MPTSEVGRGAWVLARAWAHSPHSPPTPLFRHECPLSAVLEVTVTHESVIGVFFHAVGGA